MRQEQQQQMKKPAVMHANALLCCQPHPQLHLPRAGMWTAIPAVIQPHNSAACTGPLRTCTAGSVLT